MDATNPGADRPVRLGPYVWVLALGWTLVAGLIIAWEAICDEREAIRDAIQHARRASDRDLVLRQWASTHGGLYVPATEATPPDPALDEQPERDVVTPSGRALTLLSPSRASGQFQQRLTNLTRDAPQIRSTTFQPRHAEDAPDSWEGAALQALAGGEAEVAEATTAGDHRVVRVMHPLVVEQSCLGCHINQDYQVGQVRGGISVRTLLDPWLAEQRAETRARALRYGVLWLLTLGGIVVGGRRVQHQIDRRHRAESSLQQAESELVETEAKFRAVAAAIPGVACQFVRRGDGSMAIPYVSDGAAAIFGLTPRQITEDAGRTLAGAFARSELERLRQSLADSARSMTTWTVESAMRTPDGRTRWVRGAAQPARLPCGDVVWNGVMLDITDRKLAEQELEDARRLLERRVAERTSELEESNRQLRLEVAERGRAEEEARAAQQRLLEHQRRLKEDAEAELALLRDQLVRQTRLAAVGQVSVSIAHELRNPLGVIRNAAFLLKRKIPGAEAKWHEYVQIMQDETARADTIITELMAMSRGKAPSREPVELRSLVETARARSMAPADFQWDLRFEPDPFVVNVDTALWEQALRNLFANAIHAAGPAGRITLRATRCAGVDEIVVADDGPGIPDEARLQVFEPLFTTKSKGTGLGLTICRQIVERHGGSIEILDIRPGTAFRIRLPREGGEGQQTG